MLIDKEYQFKFSGNYDNEIIDLPEIVYNLSIYAEDIHNAVARTFGISEWFFAYVSSDHFQNLSPDMKRESFRSFLGVREVLTGIEQGTKWHED